MATSTLNILSVQQNPIMRLTDMIWGMNYPLVRNMELGYVHAYLAKSSDICLSLMTPTAKNIDIPAIKIPILAINNLDFGKTISHVHSQHLDSVNFSIMGYGYSPDILYVNVHKPRKVKHYYWAKIDEKTQFQWVTARAQRADIVDE